MNQIPMRSRDVASVIGDIGFDYLDGPIKKVTAPDTPVPSANLEQAIYQT